MKSLYYTVTGSTVSNYKLLKNVNEAIQAGPLISEFRPSSFMVAVYSSLIIWEKRMCDSAKSIAQTLVAVQTAL